MEPEEWTTVGYGSAIQALNLPTRVTLRGMEVPWWAGTLAALLAAEMTAAQVEGVLRRVQHHPHRHRLVVLAQLGGWEALAPLLDVEPGDRL